MQLKLLINNLTTDDKEYIEIDMSKYKFDVLDDLKEEFGSDKIIDHYFDCNWRTKIFFM